VLIRISSGDDSATGSAMLCRDEVNGGWVPMGDSIECWLSRSVIDLGETTGTLAKVVAEVQDWRVRTVTLGDA
jgi:hypothetical protein